MKHGPLDLYIHSHYTIVWDRIKSDHLKQTRGISFEELLQCRILALRDNPTRKNQDLLLLEHADYVWAVPCVDRDGELFLKTAYPSRKYTKLWQRGELG